jgi:hypothetical protein
VTQDITDNTRKDAKKSQPQQENDRFSKENQTFSQENHTFSQENHTF